MEKQRTRWIDILVTTMLALGLLITSGTLHIAIAIMPLIGAIIFVGSIVSWLINRRRNS